MSQQALKSRFLPAQRLKISTLHPATDFFCLLSLRKSIPYSLVFKNGFVLDGNDYKIKKKKIENPLTDSDLRVFYFPTMRIVSVRTH